MGLLARGLAQLYSLIPNDKTGAEPKLCPCTSGLSRETILGIVRYHASGPRLLYTWSSLACTYQKVSGKAGKSSESWVLPGASAPSSEMTGQRTTTPGCSMVTNPSACASRMSSASSKSASG
jgi:hypothetical protein